MGTREPGKEAEVGATGPQAKGHPGSRVPAWPFSQGGQRVVQQTQSGHLAEQHENIIPKTSAT